MKDDPLKAKSDEAVHNAEKQEAHSIRLEQFYKDLEKAEWAIKYARGKERKVKVREYEALYERLQSYLDTK